MNGPFDSRHPLVGLVDETSRLTGRFKSVFATSRQSIGLNDSEIMVLNAVVEAEHAPTVAQIGRSLGHARQLIQRAANSLRDAGLVELIDNPDHKRAPLLKPAPAGIDLKRRADRQAEDIAEDLMPALGLDEVREATVALRAIRKQLEANLRTKGNS